MPAIALTIAGSDASGGAGIQADLKTFHQFGVYGQAVVTLVTVQNTQRVSRVEILAAELVRDQIQTVIEDVPPGAGKTGALGSREIVEAVAELAQTFRFPLVVDPVLISKHGGRLLSREAEEALKKNLLPHASLVTPNVPEAEALTGVDIRDHADMAEAAERLLDFGCRAVLIKGGHREGAPDDLLVMPGLDFTVFYGERIATRHTHGVGCTYSAAITGGLAVGHDLNRAVAVAKRYVQNAIESAPELGSGFGPVNHFARALEK